jgi:hypothetical protein
MCFHETDEPSRHIPIGLDPRFAGWAIPLVFHVNLRLL